MDNNNYIPLFLFEEQPPAEGGSGGSGGGTPAIPGSMAAGLKDLVAEQGVEVTDPPPAEGDGGDGGSGDDNDINLDDYTDEQLDAIEAKSEDERTDEDKKVLAALAKENEGEGGDDDNEDGDDKIITDKEYDNLLDKLDKGEELTDDEKASMDAYDDANSTINVLKGVFDFEELKDNTYEDNTQGAQQLANDAAKIIADNLIDEYFEKYPPLQMLKEHAIDNGRSLDTFLLQNQQQDFSQFDIKTEDGAEDLLRYSYSKKGLSKDKIDTLIKVTKDGGKLLDEAKDEFKTLDAIHKQEVDAKKAAEDKQIAEDKARSEQQIKDYTAAVKRGKILGVSLSKQEQAELLDFSYKVDDNGVPAAVNAYNALSEEKKALFNMILMKDFKIGGLGVKEVRERSFSTRDSRRSRRTRGSNSNTGGSGGSSNNQNNDPLKGKSFKDIISRK